jgi:hypothetical protein
LDVGTSVPGHISPLRLEGLSESLTGFVASRDMFSISQNPNASRVVWVTMPAHNSVEKVFRHLLGDTSARGIRHEAKSLSTVSVFAEPTPPQSPGIRRPTLATD